ncbi:Cytidine and deoxycytidylate deaminase zinc-binding region [compost metagenome]
MKNTIEHARQIALGIPYQRHKKRVVAVLTDRKGKVVSVGINSYEKTCAKQGRIAKRLGLDEKVFTHAESHAINQDKLMKGYKLTVVRIGARGELCYSAPCPICSERIRQTKNIKVVEFSV